MIFTHVSDTHGQFPSGIRKDSKIIYHSGDFMPNETRGIVEKEVAFQKRWIEMNIDPLKEWIGDRIFVFCPGNHDFFNPIPRMRKAGIDAILVLNELVDVAGIKVYGFPYVPYMAGEWNYEKQSIEMTDLVAKIPHCDILLAHCPPAGILDQDDWKSCGNTALANRLSFDEELFPQYVLTGHFHNGNGIHTLERKNEESNVSFCIVSNAATTIHNFQD